MAYDKEIATHIRASIDQSGWPKIEEREKNDGLSFTLKNEPLIRVEGEQVVVRCFPEDTDNYLNDPGIEQYQMNGRTDIKGWLVLTPEISHSRGKLDKWLQISYNYVSTL